MRRNLAHRRLAWSLVFLTWFARLDFNFDALTAQQWNWVYAFGALVVVRFIIGGLKMIGFFKELS